jgi:hypothetical protein
MPRLKHDRNLAAGLERVCQTSSDIRFVPRITIPSIDDDLLRLQSTKVSLFGLQHTNNPKKGLGLVHHGIVSICTGLYLGGHIASRGKSTKECIQILLRSLSGASADSVTVVRNLCAWDRGSGGAGGAINEMALGYKCNLLGTAHWSRSFPFTYGQVGAPEQIVISEAGTMDAFWVMKKKKKTSSVATLHKPVYGMAYLTGNGKVVLGHTSLGIAGPGKWTFVSC